MKNFCCFRTINILTLALVLAAMNSYAQQNYKRANLSLCDIDAEKGSVAKKENSDISIRISAHHHYADINDDGNIIAADGKLIFRDTFGWTAQKVPGHNFYGRKLRLDGSGNLLAYHQHNSKNAQIRFLNTNTFQLDSEFAVLKNHPCENIIHFDISQNAQTVAYSYFFGDGREKICVTDREGKAFSNPVEIAITELVTHIFLSSSGNRLFYNATVLKKIAVDGFERTVNVYNSFWSERRGKEWAPAQALEIPGATQAILVDIARDGEMVLMKDPVQGAAISRWEKDRWSHAEYLAFHPMEFDRMDISEDGQILVSSVTTHALSENKEITGYNTDLKIVNAKEKGNSKSQSVILDASAVIGSEFLLSRNGKKLFYVPYEIDQ